MVGLLKYPVFVLLNFLVILFFLFWPLETGADTIHVAVASNFKKAMVTLGSDFEKQSGHTLAVSSGSSGKLFAQINHGAPFQLFLSADMSRPQALQQTPLAVPGTLFTYAKGQLVLWSPNPHLFDNGLDYLTKKGQSVIALGNPRTVPYGKAAQETLEYLKLWPNDTGRLVFGENVGQVLAFVLSGNAEAGFVSLSQIVDEKGNLRSGSVWKIPGHFYSAIDQGAVRLLRPGASQPSEDLVHFLRSPTVLARLAVLGYLPP